MISGWKNISIDLTHSRIIRPYEFAHLFQMPFNVDQYFARSILHIDSPFYVHLEHNPKIRNRRIAPRKQSHTHTLFAANTVFPSQTLCMLMQPTGWQWHMYVCRPSFVCLFDTDAQHALSLCETVVLHGRAAVVHALHTCESNRKTRRAYVTLQYVPLQHIPFARRREISRAGTHTNKKQVRQNTNSVISHVNYT